MSQMEMSESRTPLLGNGTPVQETSGSDQSHAAGSQDQDHVIGSPVSTQSSPSSENESGLGTSSSAQSQEAGAQVQGQSAAGIPGAESASSSPRFFLSQPNVSRMGAGQMQCFKRKMCIKFLPSSKALQEYQTIKHQNSRYGRENIKCRCGLAFKDHEKDENEGVPLLYETVEELLNDQIAVPDFTTALFEEDGDRMNRGYKWNPRDLYRKSQIERDLSLVDTMMEVERAEIGDIEFLMNDNLTSRSQFTRLSDTTELTELKTFLKNEWKLLDPMPELVISLIGSTHNKDLADKLVSSIIKISRFVNLIILTSGLESDVVAKKIGDAVTKEQRWTTENDDQSTAKARIKCVGITTWGALKEKEKPEFLKREDKTDVYHIPKNEESHGHSFVLNPGHKYFLLVDTGTTWELSRELNTFWAEVLRELKGESPNVLNLVLGKNKDAKYTVGMTEQLLAHFPVILLQHSGKYLDAVINGILQFQEEEAVDMQRARDESGEMANTVVKFLEDQVLHDYQEKNVMVVCDLTEDDSTLLVGKNLVSAMLKTLTQPLIVTAKVNAGKPGNKDVLQVVELAAKLRYWETSMDELFTYTYDWNENEKNGLKATFKSCLLQDMPEFFPVFTRVGWLPLEEFLTVEMLAQLYSENVVNDPIQVVFKRGRFPDAGANVQNLQKLLEEMIKKLWLPRCYLPEVKGENRLEYPYKELLIWAVLSKKWHMVDYILLSQKGDNLLVWYLATAYLCRTIAARQLDMEIRLEFKENQRVYEHYGKRMLEILHVQHEVADGNNFTHLSLQEPSKTWGNLCPADLALLGNFKTFVRSEGFHNYIVKRWKRKTEGCSCQPRVKFYTHWVFYMIMVLSFCAALVSHVQYRHFAHQIWLLVWIFSYIVGEVVARSQQQKNVRFCSTLHQLWLVTRRKYLHLLLLFCFLIGGFVCTMAGSTHWGAMLYGIACLILILIIGGHFLSSFHLFAPQISILKKVFKEIFTFIILIILLIWSVAMIFNAVLCLDDKIMDYPSNSTEKTVSKSWANMFHTIWFLYLSLYGEYSFELDLTDEGHFSCMDDRSALMWVSYILIGLHILVGNVLVMNLLVSVIGTKADDLKTELVYQWKSNWYKLTLHYEAQTMFPPPFNLLELLVKLVCHCRRYKKGQDEVDATLPPSKTILNLWQYQKEAVGSLGDEVAQQETRL